MARAQLRIEKIGGTSVAVGFEQGRCHNGRVRIYVFCRQQGATIIIIIIIVLMARLGEKGFRRATGAVVPCGCRARTAGFRIRRRSDSSGRPKEGHAEHQG